MVLVMRTGAEEELSDGNDPSDLMPEGIDGILRSDGILRFHDSVDM